MTPAVTRAIRSRWLAIITHAGLWLLLYVAISGLRGTPPTMREADGTSPAPERMVPVSKADHLLNRLNWPELLAATNTSNPFFTKHFTPSPAPPPPAPTTRKIELVYHGYYISDGSKKQTMVKMADAFLVTPIGSKVTANLYAADATVLSLTLTNTASQTNLLPLNVKKELEVPIQ
jgi:hypothetical protein